MFGMAHFLASYEVQPNSLLLKLTNVSFYGLPLQGGQDHPVRPPVYSVDEDGHTEWQLDLTTHYIAKPNLFPCEEQRGWPAAAANLGSLSCQKSVQHQLSSRPPRMTPA